MLYLHQSHRVLIKLRINPIILHFNPYALSKLDFIPTFSHIGHPAFLYLQKAPELMFYYNSRSNAWGYQLVKMKLYPIT
jgi:hypothetical protein